MIFNDLSSQREIKDSPISHPTNAISKIFGSPGINPNEITSDKNLEEIGTHVVEKELFPTKKNTKKSNFKTYLPILAILFIILLTLTTCLIAISILPFILL